MKRHYSPENGKLSTYPALNTQARWLQRIALLALVFISVLYTVPVKAQCYSWQNVGGGAVTTAEGSQYKITVSSAGVPYAVFADDSHGGKITVKKYDGSSWVTVGTEAFSVDAAYGPTITVDNSEVPYVAYTNAPSGSNLFVKKFNGSSWVDVGSTAFATAAVAAIKCDPSGTPYVVFGYTALSVIKFNGSSWVYVGTPGFADAGHEMIEFDPSGVPYVVHDSDYGWYTYVSKFNGSAWVNVGPAVSTDGAVYSPSFAIDPSGVPHIAITTPSGSFVKKFSGGSWVNVGTLPVSGQLSMAIDNAGIPYVAAFVPTYGSWGFFPANVYRYSGGTWVMTGEGSVANDVNYYVSLGMGGAVPYLIYPAASYSGGYSARPTVKKMYTLAAGNTGVTSICPAGTTTLANSTAGGYWSSGNNTITTVGSATGVVTGVAGGVGYISYTYGGCSAITAVTVNPFVGTISGYRIMNAGSTTVLTSTGSSGSWTSGNTSVATVNSAGVVTGISAGTATISYSISGSCGSAYATAVVTVNPASAPDCKVWNRMGIDVNTPTSSMIWSSPLTHVAPDGTLYAAYKDDNYGGKLTVKKYNGSAWVAVGAAGFTAGTLDDASMDIAPDGTPYVAFTDNSVSGKATVMKFNGTAWVVVGTAGFTASYTYTPIVKTDGNGIPYLLYFAGINSAYTCAKFNGTSWVSLPDLPNGADAGVNNFTISPNGTLYVSFPSGGSDNQMSVLKYNGTSWVYVGAPAFSAGYGYVSALAVGADEHPCVAYYDMPNAGITVQKFNGSAWTVLGSAGAGPYGASPIGIGIDAAGSVYVGYGQGATNSQNAMKYDGTSWHTLGQDINAPIIDGAFALAPDGTPYMVYPFLSELRAVTLGAFDNTISGDFDLCSGETVVYANRADNGMWDYNYDILSTGGEISGLGTVFGAYNSGVTTLSYTVGSCSAVATVTVNGSSAGTISGTLAICSGGTSALSSDLTGGTWSSSDVYVATVGSTGVVSGVDAGTALITYTVTSACGTASSYAMVTVNLSPSAGTITGATSLCEAATTTLSNATTGGAWSSSNASVATIGSATGVVSGVAAGIVTITYTMTFSCGSSITTSELTVNGTPSAGTITGTATVCAGNTTTLNNATSGGAWSSGNTSIATVGSATGIVSGVTAGNATITYTVSSGCGSATATKVVTVNAATSAGTITGAGTTCTGGTITLGNAVSGGVWSSGNTAVAAVGPTGVVTGVSTGNATITYTVSGSCGSANATAVVTVGATASITGSLSLCSGMTSTLSGGSTGGVWSSSNTAVATIGASNGILTAVGTGTSNITYATSSGCTATAVVTVSAPALIAGTSNACVGQTATLTDATTGGVWSSSNTSLATVDASTGVVTAIAVGSTTVSYVVSAGCYRTIAFTVKALPPAIAAPVTVCEGSTVYVAPPSTNGYSWTSSNTSVAVIGSSTGMLTGVAAGTTTLTYTTNIGCFVTTEATVNTAPASITGTTALCSGTTSTLSSVTPGGVWSSSNASVAAIGSATGAFTAGSAGTATISYTAGGCRTTTVVSVSAIAAITGTPSVCVGSSTALNNASAGGTWSSSNTSIATVGTSGILSGVAAGNATVTYTLSTGCIRTVTATVVATPSGITGTLSICPSATATLSGGTPGGSWSGGNASIATINSSTGVLSGIGAGTINVSYTLTGCRVTAIATVNPLPAVITGTINACVAQIATLNNATAGGAWTSNNTGIATVDPSTGVVTGVTAATTTITYTLGSGCYRATPFTVKAPPPAIAASVAACVGTTTYVAPPSTNGKSWSSSNTAVATMGSSTGIMTGVSTGTTILTYTATTGCYVTTEATVYALPSAGTITGPTSVVVGNTITLNDATGGGVWSSGNVARATIGSATGIVTGVAGGTATMSYSVSNPGCTVRATQVISVLTSRPGDNGQVAGNSFQLYPNPTTGAFTVEVEEAGTFSIYSLDGREVGRHNINTGVNQLTLSNELASGIYMCRFTSETGNTTIVRLVYER